jgi:two-component system, chemotaxis family, protein-glutamate methylesterase/glutaminase
LRLTERVRHQIRGAGLATRARTVGAGAVKPAKAGAAAVKGRNGALRGLVLIGTSTGGPAALDIVLPQLPPDFPWPVLVAQHLPASFTGAFAKRLDRECQLNVVEVDQPMPLTPGTVYIGRGDADVMVATRATGPIAMPVPAKAQYLWHPSVERMVGSALEHFDAPHMIGVMMTGMGNDGAEAMKRLRQGGGRTIAEAESTAIVWGMPGELVKNGGAEMVRPLEDIAPTIVDMVNSHAIR